MMMMMMMMMMIIIIVIIIMIVINLDSHEFMDVYGWYNRIILRSGLMFCLMWFIIPSEIFWI